MIAATAKIANPLGMFVCSFHRILARENHELSFDESLCAGSRGGVDLRDAAGYHF
jgi:hypothetical protein